MYTFSDLYIYIYVNFVRGLELWLAFSIDMANNAPNEVDEAIKALKEEQGYTAFVLLNNDGIVIRYENMDYKTAVQFSHLVLDLYSKVSKIYS